MAGGRGDPGPPASRLLPGLRLRRGRGPGRRRGRGGAPGRGLRRAAPRAPRVLAQDSPGRRGHGLPLAFPARPAPPQRLLPGPRPGPTAWAGPPERPARSLQRNGRRRLVLSPGGVAPARPPHAPHAHAPLGGAAPGPRGHLAATCPAHGGGPRRGPARRSRPQEGDPRAGTPQAVQRRDPRLQNSRSWAGTRPPPNPDPPLRGPSGGADKPHSQGILINSAIFGEPWGKLKFKKKKTFLKEKRGVKNKSLLLMSFIISIESFLSLVNTSWWPVCGGKAEGMGNPASHTDRHDTLTPHTFSDTQECLLVIPNPTITACKNQF